jgi:uncharacterized repeat protein (TIGR03803 family)
MRSLGLGNYTLAAGVMAALLAGCGGSQPPITVPGAMAQTSTLAASSNSTNYKVVYSFSGGSDAADPFAGLIDEGGVLYGTTIAGGSYSNDCDFFYYNCGTVFSVTPSGTEKVLHSFGAGSDGRNPLAGLVDVGQTLYGTTKAGGSYPSCNYSAYFTCGTVFSITPSGTEKVLHSFSGYPSDGAFPDAALIDVEGTLYGTTYFGGRFECNDLGDSCGTVFSITTAGAESVLHDFSDRPDGGHPSAALINVKGTLYGTTGSGGRHGFGTVFSITTGGSEKVLHSFGAGNDGRGPTASLIELNGKFYGTTSGGGAYSCGHKCGYGTVFSITPGGREKVLHSFDAADGAHPSTSLIELKGTLYGTTNEGGAYSCGSNGGCGTVFSITPGGTEKVLHSFGNGLDGASPYAALIDVKGTLYGTTESGGAHGYGTVFALTP